MTTVDDYQRIHVSGVGDGTMTALARIFHRRGARVSASAVRRTPAVEALAQLGVAVVSQPNEEVLGDTGLVIHPAGRTADDAAMRLAERHGIDTLDEGAALVQMAKGHRTIAVTGTHGRATVTSMIAWILECAGFQPGFALSSRAHNFGAEGRDATDEWFVFELDERLACHREVQLDYAVCNFLELVPSTYYRGVDDIVAAMRNCLESNRRLKELFVNLDCLGNRELIRGAALRPTGYGLDHHTEFRAELLDPPDGGGYRFEAFHRDDRLRRFELSIPGRYNVVNALGAVAVAARLRVDIEVIAEALSSYQGLENRYTVATGGGVTIVKDFARHPVGVGRVVSSERRGFDGTLVGVFAPSRPETTPVDVEQFAPALADCDEVVVVDRFERRDRLEALADELRRTGSTTVRFGDPGEPLAEQLADSVRPGDKLLFFGDEDFLGDADHVQAELASRAARTEPEAEQRRFDSPLTEGDDPS